MSRPQVPPPPQWPRVCDTDEQEILQELRDRIMSEVKYFGTNNCKCITEEKLDFIFRGYGIYENK